MHADHDANHFYEHADGETKPETYGEAATAAPSDQARLDAYAAELQAQ